MQHMGPLAFNAIRFALGALVLLPVLLWGFPGQKPQPLLRSNTSNPKKYLLLGSLVTGLFIFGGSTFQQFGMVYTTAGKAGFITGLYVVFVPLLGLFRGIKTRREIWLGAFLAASGLYLLSGTGHGGIGLGDGLVLVSAIFWACHMLAVGWLVQKVNPIALAVSQFVVCSFLSAMGALVFEDLSQVNLQAVAIPILYAGILSVGAAYTLQILGQRHAHPAHAALILSMEGVFAALGGWFILSESLPLRGILGCLLMLSGIILAQKAPSGSKSEPNMV